MKTVIVIIRQILQKKNLKERPSSGEKAYPISVMKKGFLASSVSTYDFSILYTTLPYNFNQRKTN